MKPEESEPQYNAPGSASERASETASGAKESLREKAHSAKESLKEHSAAAAENLKESGSEYATEKKSKAADRIGRYGEEFDEAAQGFEADDPNIAWIAHRAADSLSNLAEQVRTKDFRSLWHDGEEIARRHPLAFMGGMFAVGAALGSFVRSARADSDEDDEFEPYSPRGSRDDVLAEEDALATPPGARSTEY